jgi:hypothetical protein
MDVNIGSFENKEDLPLGEVIFENFISLPEKLDFV